LSVGEKRKDRLDGWWNRPMSAGHAVVSGAYFARLEAGGAVEVRKAVVAR